MNVEVVIMNSEIIFNILEPTEILFNEEDLKNYFFKQIKYLYNLVEKNFGIKKGGGAYTLFIPTNLEFTGKWASFSPTVFWGINKNTDEIKKVIFSVCIYYNLWKETPPFTELWIENLSSKLPYNVFLICSNTSSNFFVELDKQNKIINIKYSKEVFLEVSAQLYNKFVAIAITKNIFKFFIILN